MVIIKSFIVRPGVIITDLEETSVNPKKYFIDLDDYTLQEGVKK